MKTVEVGINYINAVDPEDYEITESVSSLEDLKHLVREYDECIYTLNIIYTNGFTDEELDEVYDIVGG